MVVAGSSRSSLIATRASAQTKARFAALAASRGLTESALLTLLISTVLEQNEMASPPPDADPEARAPLEAGDRITLRLRPGDRSALNRRAAARQMKPSSYLCMLLRSHLRRDAPLPMQELNELKAGVGRLSALERHLQRLAYGDASVFASSLDVVGAVHEATKQVKDVRAYVASVVKTNLMSWESDDG